MVRAAPLPAAALFPGKPAKPVTRGGIPEEPEELTLPISEDGAELDVWINYSGTIVGDVNEIAGVQKMEEMTGVHINWTPVAQNELQEKFGILLSSGTYPDIVYPVLCPTLMAWTPASPMVSSTPTMTP